MNLASLKYQSVLKEVGGPVERVETSLVSIFGVPTYIANAFLVPEFARNAEALELYGNASGTGESKVAQVARFKAISEALERWAHRVVWHSAEGKKYGFDVDPTTTGMSAFPGLFRRQARPGAVFEAAERLAVLSWWEGHGNSTPLPPLREGIQAIRLEATAPKCEVVIVYWKSPKLGHYVYGTAAGRTVAEAQERAIGELARSDFLLTSRKEKGLTSVPKHLFERRCLFFAEEEGFQRFQARIKTQGTKPLIPWAPLFDGEIVGPWSKYATVWRVAHRMPSKEYMNWEANGYFFW